MNRSFYVYAGSPPTKSLVSGCRMEHTAVARTARSRARSAHQSYEEPVGILRADDSVVLYKVWVEVSVRVGRPEYVGVYTQEEREQMAIRSASESTKESN